MNVFDYIQAYVSKSTSGQYGDYLSNSEETTDKVEQLLDGEDLAVYKTYKQKDKLRIINSSSTQSKNYNRVIPPNYYRNVQGIGLVKQIC